MSMNIHNNSNNKYDNSVVLRLEHLTNEYDNILLKYQQAVANYTSFLQQTDNLSKSPFIHLKGNSYWGQNPVGDQSVYTDVKTPSACEALCSKTSGCSGATFANNNGMFECFLRSGDGQVVPSGSQDYAIVPLSKKYLLNIHNLNQQLTDLNQEIVSLIAKKGETIYSSEQAQRAVKGKQLQDNYNKLVQERKIVEQKIQSFQDLESEEYNSELSTNSNYLSYILLLTLAIFIIFILVKISFGNGSAGNQPGGVLSFKAYYIIFAILFFILFIYYYKNFIKF